MRRLLCLCMLLAPGLACAQGWSAAGCGDEPRAPSYDLTTRAGYNAAVKKANAYQEAARDYSACVLKQAHADQTAISRQAQDRIASIQAAAVSRQQAIYGKLAAQAAAFKQAAAALKNK